MNASKNNRIANNCLLQAVEVPECHGRTVKVKVDNTNSLKGNCMLFSLQQNNEDWSGIVNINCVSGKVLTVENHNLDLITLSVGHLVSGMCDEICNIQPTIECYKHVQISIPRVNR